MTYLKEIAKETKELEGLHISCRSSLYRRMGITTKAQVIDGLSKGEISVNNGKIWGKRRHQLLLDWLEPRTCTQNPETLDTFPPICLSRKHNREKYLRRGSL
jgi:hypothetical protein